MDDHKIPIKLICDIPFLGVFIIIRFITNFLNKKKYIKKIIIHNQFYIGTI